MSRLREQYDLNKSIEQFITNNPSSKTTYTPEQKQFIAQFSGYGGLEKVGAEGEGILYEYYTPDEPIKTMWRLCLEHGFKGGNVLEPACGTGRFLALQPQTAQPIFATGIEPNAVSATIAQITNSQATIQQGYFEQTFIRNNNTVGNKVTEQYDLVIGNPPYGDISQGQGGRYMEMGERKYTQAGTYIDYFILRGLDLLKSGGLLCYIIGSAQGKPFLAQGDSATKQTLLQKADLVEAYRLPDGVFERTDVVADILLLRKK